MRQVYTSIILLITMLFGAMTIAQEEQKRFINYQGVARNADGDLMSAESLTIGVKLNFGSSGVSFEETHDLTTDANGVFSLLIGKGNVLSGDYTTLPWGDFATRATVSINGNEIGTTELMAVPHALSSADNQWHTMGDDIENKNGGNVFVTGSLYASKDLSLAEGAAVNEFSTDITLGGNSDEIVPTQKAVKTYVDSQLGGSGGGADDQTAAEVAYDNSVSGLTATTAQTAIDELVDSGVVDADSDPNNEIQTLNFNIATNELSLTDGGSVTLPSGGTDADADPTNELQDISLSGTELTISDGSTVDLAPIVPPGGTDDQNLILTGDVLSIENGSGSVDLSTYAGDDADADPTNEIDVTAENGLLMGDGSIVTGLVGMADGQVAKWNAGTSEWEAGTDLTGGGGGSLWTDNGGDIYYNDGEVGVGTTNPTGKLHVSQNSGGFPFLKLETKSGDNVNMRYTKAGVNETWDQIATIGADDASSKMNLSFYDGGTLHPVMTLRGNRRMGINNPNPQSTLDVQGKIRSTLLTGAGERNVKADANGNLIIGAGGGGSSLWEENEDGIYRSNGNASIGHTPLTNAKLYVHSAAPGGRNGISSYVFHPGYKVGISGSAVSNDNELTFGMRSSVTSNAGATSYAYRADINGSGSGTKYGIFSRIHSGTGGLKYGIYSDGEDRNYFSGNVGIGIETTAAKLHVKDNSTVSKPHIKLEEEGADYARLEFTNNTSNALWHIAGLADNNPANSKLNFYFRNNNGAANRMTITGDGNVFVDGSLAHSSDLRLKKDIKELPYGLKELLVLDPKIYSWIDNRNNGSMSLGLIAQEVQQVIPEIVHEDDDSEKTLSLSYTELIPVVITAIKEQQQVINKQAEKISDLEARLTVLEAKL